MTAIQERLLALAIFTAAMSVGSYLITKLVHSLNDTAFVVYFVVLYGGVFTWWLLSRRRSHASGTHQSLDNRPD